MSARVLSNRQINASVEDRDQQTTPCTTPPRSPFKPELVRCSSSFDVSVNPPSLQAGENRVPASTTRMRSFSSWSRRLFDRIDGWSWQGKARARESYLARSQNISDLEARMRDLDTGEFSRAGRIPFIGGL
jgi:hypothetical protein